MTTSTYTVSGMTCDHCARSVSEEISEIDGVRTVRVDVPSGAVTVESEQPLAASEVRAAVDEAGYRLVES